MNLFVLILLVETWKPFSAHIIGTKKLMQKPKPKSLLIYSWEWNDVKVRAFPFSVLLDSY